MAIPSIFYGWDEDPGYGDEARFDRYDDEPLEEVEIEYPARPARKPVISEEQPDRAKEKQA